MLWRVRTRSGERERAGLLFKSRRNGSAGIRARGLRERLCDDGAERPGCERTKGKLRVCDEHEFQLDFGLRGRSQYGYAFPATGKPNRNGERSGISGGGCVRTISVRGELFFQRCVRISD